MITFDIITIFPNIFDSYLKESIIARAQKEKLIKIRIHNLRDWTNDRHKTVDDKPYGGERGMVLKIEPIYRAVQFLKPKIKNQKLKTILFTPRGKKLDQKMVYRFSKLNRLIMICGRYEGVDERVAKYIADEEVSMGDYVLMGGELPAMTIIESVARLIPGVLGKPQLLKERITKEGGFIEYAEYTHPEIFSHRKGRQWRVPGVLLSGNHKRIEEWKRRYGKEIL